MLAKTFLLCQWANAQSAVNQIAAPADLQWTWVWSFTNSNVVSASIVGGACPAGADGFQLGAIASPGDPKSNIIGIAACGGTETAPFNNGDTALGVIRWTKGMIPVSPWSSQKSVLVQLDPVVQTFITNITNLQGGGGGPFPNMPSLDTTTTSALDSFVKGCKSDGIWSNMIEVNCVLRIPGGVDNLSLAAMPLIVGPEGAPDHGLLWTRLAFSEANLTINGLLGVPVNSTQMISGIHPSNTFKAISNVGISMYISTITASANTIDLGAFSLDNLNCLLLYCNSFTNHSAAGCWNQSGADGPSAATPNLPGFYSFSRRAANDTSLYFANSTNAFAQIGSNNILTGTWFNTNVIKLWCCTASTGTSFDFSDRRISFIAFHDGLTTAQTQLLFNRVQTLRTSLGGGFA